jgi:putative ABC transport system permease protein
MILQLSRQTVRRSWPAYAGAFVALAVGIILLGLTVALNGAVAVATDRPTLTRDERAELENLSSMFGVMSGISLFMAVFVVGSTFGFVVATRRRELGLLRLVGATPKQVRRLILAESGVVAVTATLVGCLATTLLTPAALWLLRDRLTDVHLEEPTPWLAWVIAAPSGAVVALLGSWRSSRRASRVPPAAALREATVERNRPTILQTLIGVLCLAGVVAVTVFTSGIPPMLALIIGVFLPNVMVIGVMCFGTLLLPRLAALIARPFARRDVTARLARDQLMAAVRTTSALAAPILAISGIAGSIILVLSFTVDWTSAKDREQLTAPLVVESGGGGHVAAAVDADPTVAAVDARRLVSVGIDGASQDADVVDPASAAKARGLRAVEGDLDDFRGRALAVSSTFAMDYGDGVGDTVPAEVNGERLELRIAAVVPDAPDLYGEILIPEDLVAGQVLNVEPDLIFVVPREGVTADEARHSLTGPLEQSGSQVWASEAWIDEVEARNRAGNQLGLWVLLGPAGLYAAIAMVNATLIGASQRRHQDAVIRLLGATPRQVRRLAMWEAGFIGAAGLTAGSLVSGLTAWLVRRTITNDVGDTAVTVPWVPLLAIGATCIALVVTAALAGTRVHEIAARATHEPDPA